MRFSARVAVPGGAFPGRWRTAALGFVTLMVAALAGAAAPLDVMTYNLRFASETPPHAWSARRPLVRDVIRSAGPDVIGTQEGLYAQLRDLADDLPDYSWIGLGRGGGSRDEFTAIFYRTARLEPLAFDHFWLSDSPDVVGSITWGHRFRRMATWVRFRDRESGAVFSVWNTHFDHEVQPAREKSARLLIERIARDAADEPVVLLGDFNAAAESNPVYDILRSAGFVDAWTAAARRSGEGVATFNGFGAEVNRGERIDWILTRGVERTESAAVLQPSEPAVYPSDHYPVVARIHITPKSGSK